MVLQRHTAACRLCLVILHHADKHVDSQSASIRFAKSSSMHTAYRNASITGRVAGKVSMQGTHRRSNDETGSLGVELLTQGAGLHQLVQKVAVGFFSACACNGISFGKRQIYIYRSINICNLASFLSVQWNLIWQNIVYGCV